MTTPHCPEISDLIDDYRFNRLAAVERARVTEHLQHCADCSADLQFRNILAQELSTPQDAVMPPGLNDEIRRAIRSQASESSGPAKTNMLPWMMAAAALIVIGAGLLQMNSPALFPMANSSIESQKTITDLPRSAHSKNYDFAEEPPAGNYNLMEAEIRPEPRRRDKEVAAATSRSANEADSIAMPVPASEPIVAADAPSFSLSMIPAAVSPASDVLVDQTVAQAGEPSKLELSETSVQITPSSSEISSRQIASADKSNYARSPAAAFELKNSAMNGGFQAGTSPAGIPPSSGVSANAPDKSPDRGLAVQKKAKSDDSKSMIAGAVSAATPASPTETLHSLMAAPAKTSENRTLKANIAMSAGPQDQAEGLAFRAAAEKISTDTLTSATLTSSTLQSTAVPMMEYHYP